MINYKNKLIIRKEKNGIVVYEKETNLYKFYEGIDFSKIDVNKDVETFLLNNKNKINRNIDYQYPIRINWLIEEKCNLDCIYCFAHDKMNNKATDKKTQNTTNVIKRLNVLNVGLSGGEPTLNPYLPNIISELSKFCSVNLDTNGITPNLPKIAEPLKNGNVLVRLTIDSVDNDILMKLRPNKHKTYFDYMSILEKNIKILRKNNIKMMVHSVVTQINKNNLVEIGYKLIELGITRWHLYGVNYSEKCKDFYDKIKVTNEQLKECEAQLNKLFSDKINISFYFDEGNYSANSVIMVNCKGEFFLDTIFNGYKYIGKDPTNPSLDEINKNLDIKLHCYGYLWEDNSER